MRSFILPALGYLGYPMAVAGAVLVFATSTLFTLDMISDNIGSMTAPIAASPDFNVPPVEQIGSLQPPPAAAPPAETATPQLRSSVVSISPPGDTFAAVATQPDAPLSSSVDAGALSGRIGSQAVNVRAGPSKTAVTLGVLNAGTPVGIGENVGGWVHVSFNGGDGWVYKSYLETNSSISID
jgi:hypothetical protein